MEQGAVCVNIRHRPGPSSSQGPQWAAWRSLSTTLDGTIPALENTLSSAALRAQDTVDRAYRRALQLLIAALVGGLLVWLAATWVRGRRALAR